MLCRYTLKYQGWGSVNQLYIKLARFFCQVSGAHLFVTLFRTRKVWTQFQNRIFALILKLKNITVSHQKSSAGVRNLDHTMFSHRLYITIQEIWRNWGQWTINSSRPPLPTQTNFPPRWPNVWEGQMSFSPQSPGSTTLSVITQYIFCTCTFLRRLWIRFDRVSSDSFRFVLVQSNKSFLEQKKVFKKCVNMGIIEISETEPINSGSISEFSS
jgi:hypothetical protein